MMKFTSESPSATSTPPTASSYALTPSLLLAGAYPGHSAAARHRPKDQALEGARKRNRLGAGLWGVLVCLSWLASDALCGDPDLATKRLAEYRTELDAARQEFGGSRPLPSVQFFLFGMGARPKLVYKSGTILESSTGKVLRQWPVKSETIVPCDYCVSITTTGDAPVRIVEDEQAIWIEEDGRRQPVAGSQNPLRLPAFSEHRYPRVLRVLHQELLVNVIDGKPVPNYFVYPRPWYRDGAMVAMCLKATGNLDLIKDWVLGLREPYDRNNGGQSEADNLGQALYLVSLVGDRTAPLVPRILQELPRWEVHGPAGKYVQGRTDGAAHPAYQTKWAKFGLASLGLADPYVVPAVADSYSALFWMAYKDSYVKGRDANDRSRYPYLGWACDHFHGAKASPIGDRDYPLTWEQQASQARYEGMKIIGEEYVRRRLAAPHTWHAAEVFLYLLEQKSPGTAAVGDEKTAHSDLFNAEMLDLTVGGARAFILRPVKPPAGDRKPWVWLAPAFADSSGNWSAPAERHAWLFQRLLAGGSHVVGIDVGESWGNPAGRAKYEQFYHVLVTVS